MDTLLRKPQTFRDIRGRQFYGEYPDSPGLKLSQALQDTPLPTLEAALGSRPRMAWLIEPRLGRYVEWNGHRLLVDRCLAQSPDGVLSSLVEFLVRSYCDTHNLPANTNRGEVALCILADMGRYTEVTA